MSSQFQFAKKKPEFTDSFDSDSSYRSSIICPVNGYGVPGFMPSKEEGMATRAESLRNIIAPSAPGMREVELLGELSKWVSATFSWSRSCSLP